MKIILQSAKILDWSKRNLCERIESAARICYRSDQYGLAECFVRKRIEQRHLAVLEFARIAFSSDYIANARQLYEWLHPKKPFDRTCNEHFAAFCYHNPEICNDFASTLASLPLDGEKYPRAANDYIPVLLTCNRAQSHQIVRHRLCSFAQESQRYCRYDGERFGGQVEFIEPVPHMGLSLIHWEAAIKAAESSYFEMLKNGASPQQARLVLPNSAATRLVVYASKDEWRHIFSLRCDPAADPAMQALMQPLQVEMQERGFI